MRSPIAIISLTLFFILTPVVQAGQLGKRGPIVSETKPTTLPTQRSIDHLAMVARFDPDTRTFAYLSSAVVIDPATAITAAHTLTSQTLDNLFLLRLRHPPSWEVDFYPISVCTTDARYAQGDKSYDYAVLRLDEPIENLEPIALAGPNHHKVNGDSLGWTREPEGLSPIILPPKTIDASHSGETLIPLNTLQSEALPPKTRIGSGNSGSPLFETNPVADANRLTLAGILSAVIKSPDRSTDERVIYIPSQTFAHLLDEGQLTSDLLEKTITYLNPKSNKISFYRKSLIQTEETIESPLHLFVHTNDLGSASNPKAWETLKTTTDAFTLITLCQPEHFSPPTNEDHLGQMQPGDRVELTPQNGDDNQDLGIWEWKLCLSTSTTTAQPHRYRIELENESSSSQGETELALWSMETRKLIARQSAATSTTIELEAQTKDSILITIRYESPDTKPLLILELHSLDTDQSPNI